MKVTITLDDTADGIYPVVSWVGNGITDNLEQSISMTLAAQIAYLIRRSAQVGALKVVDQKPSVH